MIASNRIEEIKTRHQHRTVLDDDDACPDEREHALLSHIATLEDYIKGLEKGDAEWQEDAVALNRKIDTLEEGIRDLRAVVNDAVQWSDDRKLSGGKGLPAYLAVIMKEVMGEHLKLEIGYRHGFDKIPSP